MVDKTGKDTTKKSQIAVAPKKTIEEKKTKPSVKEKKTNPADKKSDQAKPATKTDKNVALKAPETKPDLKAAEKPVKEVIIEKIVVPVEDEEQRKIKQEIAKKFLEEEFRVIPFLKMAMYLEASQKSEKYVIIFDKTEQADKYFQYKATLKDFHAEVMNFKIGEKTKEEALEVLRKGIVYSMKIGNDFVINTGKLLIDWKGEWTSETQFPLEVFNRDEWHEREQFIRIVTEEENVGLEGDKMGYDMRHNWNMVLLA